MLKPTKKTVTVTNSTLCLYDVIFKNRIKYLKSLSLCFVCVPMSITNYSPSSYVFHTWHRPILNYVCQMVPAPPS